MLSDPATYHLQPTTFNLPPATCNLTLCQAQFALILSLKKEGSAHMKILLIAIALMLGVALLFAANPVQTVPQVDLQRYLGKWYQIAYFPTRFQPNKGGMVTAEYSLDAKGDLRVVNTSYKDDQGKEIRDQAIGRAWSVDKSNAKLKVKFVWFISGNYWIVKLDEQDYRYTVVSDPSRKYLWILSRSPAMDRQVYKEITDYLRQNGWKLDKLALTGKLK
jgi:apolipoprotein D and lipocalin family protein